MNRLLSKRDREEPALFWKYVYQKSKTKKLEHYCTATLPTTIFSNASSNHKLNKLVKKQLIHIQYHTEEGIQFKLQWDIDGKKATINGQISPHVQ